MIPRERDLQTRLGLDGRVGGRLPRRSQRHWAARDHDSYADHILCLAGAIKYLATLGGRSRREAEDLLRRELGVRSGSRRWDRWRREGLPPGMTRYRAWAAVDRITTWLRAEAYFTADRIRDLRGRLDWRQTDLADTCDVTRRAVADWERGVHAPDRRSLERLTELARAAAGLPRRPAPGEWPAEEVAALRMQLGWTQEQLGGRIGVTGTAVCSWEHDRARPRRALRARLDQVRAALDSGDLPTGDPAGDWPPDRIRALRERLGWTRERLCMVLGVSASSVSRWELGSWGPDDDHRLALAALEAEQVRGGEARDDHGEEG